jgi:hypothetical protein
VCCTQPQPHRPSTRWNVLGERQSRAIADRARARSSDRSQRASSPVSNWPAMQEREANGHPRRPDAGLSRGGTASPGSPAVIPGLLKGEADPTSGYPLLQGAFAHPRPTSIRPARQQSATSVFLQWGVSIASRRSWTYGPTSKLSQAVSWSEFTNRIPIQRMEQSRLVAAT